MPIRNFLAMEQGLINCHEGEGLVKFREIFAGDDFKTGFSFIHHTVLPPQTTIGIHQHSDDEEFYVVLSGFGEMFVDGETSQVKKGDVILNPPFGTHGLKNTSPDIDLELLVFCASNEK